MSGQELAVHFDFLIFILDMRDSLSALELFVRVARAASFSRAGGTWDRTQNLPNIIIVRMES